MKIFAAFLLVFVSAAVLVPALPTLSRICGWGGDEPSRPAFLFDAELTSEPEWRPFYFTWNQLYDYEWVERPERHDDLLDEWSSYLGTTATREDIRKIIFDASPEDVQRMISFIRSPGQASTDPLLVNPLVQSLRNRRDDDFLAYLSFAKRCEPAAVFSNSWDEGDRVERHGDTMRVLLADGLSHYESTRSPFFKLRYGYQIVRLAHYLEEHQKAVDLYATHIAPLKSTSPIAYWALEQKAGALRSLGMVAEAAYDFSVVFDRTESRKYPSYLSFRIQSDSAWDAAIRLCAGNHEKSVLHFLRGINAYNNTVEEMENIYALEPSSGMLNTLLVREINKQEERIYRMESAYDAGASTPRERRTASLERFSAFIVRCVAEGKVKNLQLWRLADAYVESLLGNPDAAVRKLAALRPVVTDELSLRSIDLIRTAIDVEGARTLTAENEDKLFKRVLDGQHDKLLRFTIDRFEKVLAAQGDTVEAYLCKHNMRAMKEQMDLELTDRVLQWLDHRDKTSFTEFLVDSRLAGSRYFDDYRSAWERPGDARGKLLELKGTILASRRQFRDAVFVLEQRQGEPLEPLRTDPFSARINDCRDCDFTAEVQYPHTKLTLLKAILSYEEQVKTDPVNAARYHYLLGNAYYNMTHFGNSAEAALYYRDADLWFSQYAHEFEKSGKIPMFLDCSAALEHYQKAMMLAEAAGDKELAAESCFMAAKCEQNRYYVTVLEDQEKGTIKNLRFRTYFKRLKERYVGTAFYGRALAECRYFSSYASRP